MAMKKGDDPKDFKVDEVEAYLANADEAEKSRVLEAEVQGKNRKGLVGDGEANADGTSETAFLGEEPVKVVPGGENDDGTPQGDQDGGAVEAPPVEVQQQAMQEAAEEQLAQVRGVSESDGESGPMGATIANQQPVTVTGKDLANRIPKGATIKVTPTNPTDGGDGSRPAPATKVTDNIWTPFKANPATYAGTTVAAATSTASNGQKAATIAANALTKF